MNKNDFIRKLISIYEDFTEKNIKSRTEAYCLALDDDLDFEKIFKYLLKEHESFRFAPTPAFILKVIIPKIKADEQKEKPRCNEKGEININVYNPSL